METPRTLIDAIRFYADENNCIEVVQAMRWPNGVTCPHCDAPKHYWLAKQRKFKCAVCRKQWSVKVGTIFEDSPIKLDKWLVATWMVANCKNGISSYEIARDLGVTQKTAWFMLHRIRLVMQDDFGGGMLKGEVEVDETFIGGKARNMHTSKRKIASDRRHYGKTIVMGMIERGGKVRTEVIADRVKPVLHAHIAKHVEEGAKVFTDELVSYWGLEEKYVHQVINHAYEYVRENVHTNTMENFWSLLKRGLNGTYVSVEPFHLFRYIDEQAFRFNNRGDSDAGRFRKLLKGIAGKRLTYVEVTGKGLETASA